MNSPVEHELLAALTQLAATVQAMSAAKPKPDLRPIFARIEELVSSLPRDTDPALLHYLHKHSYEKARLFLLGREAENQAGNCRHLS